MADHSSPVMPDDPEFRFEGDRMAAFLSTLERMAAGQLDERLPISPRRDTLDAIAHGINVLVGELEWVGARTREALEEKARELRTAVASAEARTGALLKAIPDLMFVMLRDGTFVDYRARDAKLLFVPPGTFLGRTVRDIMPPPLADVMMDALDRAYSSEDPVVVEYELPMEEPRFFEARIVRVDTDRLLSIVRDITDTKRTVELNRNLARRLIASQEAERQRLARELHDDVSQRLVVLNLEIDQIAERTDDELRARMRQLSAQAREIGRDLHDLAYDLHPSKLRIVGIVNALHSLCREMSQQRNLLVTFTHAVMPESLNEAVELCLYRIVQEALHNVAQHSSASDVQVSVLGGEDHVALQISDTGVGFDPKQVTRAGLGLVSMRERVVALNGDLSINAEPGRGTRISVRIPLDSHVSGSRVAKLTSEIPEMT